ncbi:hypothetical protein B0J11DRAFT_525368 [Dendryphion nanum]|uniref:F-box domain-containing protein n=1 Tax=Dendryphion nanum TaxID=256645 RepID=A0A9P9IRM7_9PLEO|nr:hypothetical protein B0J11DRAFT_525368 [Dendryphion nanum]
MQSAGGIHFPLQRLPSELLLPIAGYLNAVDKNDLISLSLVSRTMRPIAQEVLHQTIKLSFSQDYSKRVHKLLRVLRTLMDRPDLALQVHALEFLAYTIFFGRLDKPLWLNFQDTQKTAADLVASLEPGDEKHWLTDIRLQCESAYAGLLLVLAPNLQSLRMRIAGLSSSEEILLYPQSLVRIFGPKIPVPLAERILGSIETLSIHTASQVFYLMLRMPKLKSLRIEYVHLVDFDRIPLQSIIGASGVKRLSLHISIGFFLNDLLESHAGLGPLLSHLACTSLTHLELEIWNDIGSDDYTHADSRNIVKNIEPFISTLESLVIKWDEEGGKNNTTGSLTPTLNLKHFTNLKRISVPSGSFSWVEEGFRCDDASVMLPLSIQEVEISDINASIMDGIRRLRIQDAAWSFPNLTQIKLRCKKTYQVEYYSDLPGFGDEDSDVDDEGSEGYVTTSSILSKDQDTWRYLLEHGVQCMVYDEGTRGWHKLGIEPIKNDRIQ